MSRIEFSFEVGVHTTTIQICHQFILLLSRECAGCKGDGDGKSDLHQKIPRHGLFPFLRNIEVTIVLICHRDSSSEVIARHDYQFFYVISW